MPARTYQDNSDTVEYYSIQSYLDDIGYIPPRETSQLLYRHMERDRLSNTLQYQGFPGGIFTPNRPTPC